MPVDDAVSLIGRSFDAYQLAKREKEAAARPAAAPAARVPAPFVPPSQDILYLLNLLADKRQLTVDELDKVIAYLTERRDKLLEADGRLPPKAYPGREEDDLMSVRHLTNPLDSDELYNKSPKALRTNKIDFVDQSPENEVNMDVESGFVENQLILSDPLKEPSSLSSSKSYRFSHTVVVTEETESFLSEDLVGRTEYQENLRQRKHGVNEGQRFLEKQKSEFSQSRFEEKTRFNQPSEKKTTGFNQPSEKTTRFNQPSVSKSNDNRQKKNSNQSVVDKKNKRLEAHYNKDSDEEQVAQSSSGKPPNYFFKLNGPDVLPAIAEVVQTVCTTTSNVFRVVERYNIPINCLNLKPPKVPDDVYKAIAAQHRSYDNFLQVMHMQIGLACVPLIKCCTFFQYDQPIDSKVVYEYLKDSMLLLCNLILEISIKRRNRLRDNLPQNRRWLCVRKMFIGQFLFPDDLLNTTRDSKFLKKEFDKTHKTEDEEKHIFAQQLINQKRVQDSQVDIAVWEFIADLVNTVSVTSNDQQLLKSLREKYPIPENCQCLRPPHCNESVWNLIDRHAQNMDRDLQSPQRMVGHAVVPVIKMLESIKFVNEHPSDMFSMLKESLYILCAILRDISSIRRRYLKAALPERLKVRCEKWIPIGRYLCSDGSQSYGGAGESKPEAQKDLQAKILSILNGPGESGAGSMSQIPQGNGALDGRQGGGGMSSLINLDNPNIQKALDNLIQSGPNLLKSLSHAPGAASQPGVAMMSRESQHVQPQPSMGRDPYGAPPPRAQGAGMQQMASGRQPFGGVGNASGQAPRMGAPGGMPPRRPPPQY